MSNASLLFGFIGYKENEVPYESKFLQAFHDDAQAGEGGSSGPALNDMTHRGDHPVPKQHARGCGSSFGSG